ncbi:hypothetical protein CPTAKMNP4_255 [Salmonella phage vB_SenM-AKM_NP4]|nr:hypothetical protein I133_gp011 [Salmonella phage vB_SenM-S16]YP_009147982.1 hypothetical protein ACQ31_gp057 [Salmonella phage STML-198]WDR21920.1 hypothetical protein PJM34_0252 [Salmonella phage vB_SenM_UTK0003]WLI71877.1 hypothetical protein CPTAKMNP4_255 [Salmonella phage vB_SenM-AKM_NP4]AFU63940.1 hypothetical protein [Salmonella phage STML-198]AGE48218.1 hypothetical protein [Salmonella phage vB_SenM-S16]
MNKYKITYEIGGGTYWVEIFARDIPNAVRIFIQGTQGENKHGLFIEHVVKV